MANLVLPHESWDRSAKGRFLTFVIPAASGCNLNCSFCVIAQRAEISAATLTPSDYAHFIRGVAKAAPVAGVALQGYDPLLPESLSYTQAILRTCRDLTPVSLVTNGTHLRGALPLLTALTPDRIGVSIDSAEPDRHDKLRGVRGAWAATVDGVAESLRQLPEMRRRMTIISVLMPGRRAYLEGMPRLLERLGLREWIVNPLMVLGKPASPREDHRLIDDMLALQAMAHDHGIHFTADDQLGLLRGRLQPHMTRSFARLNVGTLPPGILLSRLVPSGHCSIGVDIARPLCPDAPRWSPDADPAEFLHAAITRHRAGIALAA